MAAEVSAALLVLCVSAATLEAVELDKAVTNLRDGIKPDSNEQAFWRQVYKSWIDSEASGAPSGDPLLGKALSSLAEGELPDEQGTSAVLRLYNVTLSRQKALSQDYTQSEVRRPGTRPRNRGTSNYLMYFGVFAGFLLAIAVPAVLGRLYRP
ncbi:MAG: hypothetical protein JW909_10415 [Planctomycetes bacterium]|nr:hypothetical protein [Planctomycetota bacterium]